MSEPLDLAGLQEQVNVACGLIDYLRAEKARLIEENKKLGLERNAHRDALHHIRHQVRAIILSNGLTAVDDDRIEDAVVRALAEMKAKAKP